MNVGAKFVKAVRCGEIETLSLDSSGEPIVFDAFINDPHGDWPLLVYRDSNGQFVSKTLHLSRVAEFAKMLRDEADAEMAAKMGTTKKKVQKAAKKKVKKAAKKTVVCICGSTQEPIIGDDVYPGYTGFPICPDCRRC